LGGSEGWGGGGRWIETYGIEFGVDLGEGFDGVDIGVVCHLDGYFGACLDAVKEGVRLE
jgi:hypothetical protein